MSIQFKKLTRPIALALLMAAANTALAADHIARTIPASFATQADCLFAWGETNYPALFAPVGAFSAEFDAYYYRYYSLTNSYLGVSSLDDHLYYMGEISGNDLLDLGAASTWFAQAGCAASSEGSKEDVQGHIDNVLQLTSDTLGGGLTDQIQPILMAVLGNPSTCPVVSMNVNLAEATDLNSFLQNLPKPTIATLSYGAGCNSENGDVMSGDAELRLNNLDINQTTGDINALLSITANNLTRNGVVISDGGMTANIALKVTDMEAATLSGGGTVQLSNYLIPNGLRLNGEIALTAADAGNFTIGVNVSYNNAMSVVLDLIAANVNDDMLLSTQAPGRLNQYAVTLNAIKYNSELCEAYPIGGTMTFSAGQQSWTATFDDRCDGSYLLQ